MTNCNWYLTQSSYVAPSTAFPPFMLHFSTLLPNGEVGRGLLFGLAWALFNTYILLSVKYKIAIFRYCVNQEMALILHKNIKL